MSELDKVPPSMMNFSGSPSEIGGQIWERMCLPAVRKIANTQSTDVLVELYAGFVLAAFGSMTADLGAENAVSISQQLQNAHEVIAKTLTDGPAVH